MGKVEPRSHVQKGGACWRDMELFMLTPVLLATIVPGVLCGDMALFMEKYSRQPLPVSQNHPKPPYYPPARFLSANVESLQLFGIHVEPET